MANKLSNLRARKDPERLRKSLYEEFASLQEDENIEFVIEAMAPTDHKYTQKSKDEARRVAEQIRQSFNLPGVNTPVFTLQGSVTSDTHIKGYSDIDLLVLEQRFLYIDSSISRPPYKGDAIADFAQLREHCGQILKGKFPAAVIDMAPGKAINMSGGSLQRDVDVVIASWRDTQEFIATTDVVYRGVSVFDSAARQPIHNLPFLHNFRIDEKDATVGGNLRRVIRLLKSIKSEADTEVKVSSYDIAGIGYCMPAEQLSVPPGAELTLLERSRSWLELLCSDAQLRGTLKVPNGIRAIFGADGTSIEGLNSLSEEVRRVSNNVRESLNRSFRRIEEAGVLPSSIQKSFEAKSLRQFDRSQLIF